VGGLHELCWQGGTTRQHWGVRAFELVSSWQKKKKDRKAFLGGGRGLGPATKKGSRQLGLCQGQRRWRMVGGGRQGTNRRDPKNHETAKPGRASGFSLRIPPSQGKNKGGGGGPTTGCHVIEKGKKVRAFKPHDFPYKEKRGRKQREQGQKRFQNFGARRPRTGWCRVSDEKTELRGKKKKRKKKAGKGGGWGGGGVGVDEQKGWGRKIQRVASR